MKYKDLQRYFPDRIFTFAELHQVIPESRESVRAQIQVMVKRGDVQPLKRGVYCLAHATVTPYQISNKLVQPSYLSLETALAQYQLIPDVIRSLTAITSKKTQSYQNSMGLFVYRHLPHHQFFGITEEKGILLASPEKALLDYLYLNSRQFSVTISCLQEARFQNLETLDFALLKTYAKKFNQKKLIALVHLLESYLHSSDYGHYL